MIAAVLWVFSYFMDNDDTWDPENLIETDLNEMIGSVKKHKNADISNMKNILRVETRIDFHEGLKRTVEWFMGSQRTEDR